MNENWKIIKYAPNYEVSSLGNIKNIKTQRLITINYQRLKKDNIRARPGLSHNGKKSGYYLHRIVAGHFIDNPKNLPEVNHIDGDFYNNKAENLEWVSKLDNMGHASENKLMKRYTRKVIITNKETGEENLFDKVSDCAEYLNCNPGKISRTCRGKRVDKLYNMKYENEERKLEENGDIIWKEYPECTKYLVSNTGEVKNKKTGRLMMGSKVNGYRFVNFHPGNKDTPKMNRLIHRMVAQTFLENPDNKPVVNHKDTNILNNNVDNLEWVTYKENMNTEETIKNLKKGKNSKMIHQILIETGEIVNTFDGASECQKKTNIDSRNVLKICNYYSGNKEYGGGGTFKGYKKKYIFIFDEDKSNLDDFLKIARCNERTDNQKKLRKPIVQINKDTNEIIKSFESINAAANELNIGQSGISQCCNHYKYTDEDRPNCYKYSRQYKGYIFKYK
tara:strand:- start:331 stop:1674 length:1344 start_codon:yes stop_codon:yes gene_type:complete